MNNPLNATDPSGFFFKSLWDKVRPFVGAIVAIVATYVCSGNVSCGQAAWAWIGAASGAAGAAANGGNILTGAITGVISGAVFYGIGTQFTGAAEGGFGHVMAHATAGGVLSVLQGGKFGHGFVSAGLTKAANISKIMANDAGGFADAVRTTIAAIVGGTISKITGGKFANGAITAAMAQAFNANESIQREVDQNQRIQQIKKLMSGSKEDRTKAAFLAADLAGIEIPDNVELVVVPGMSGDGFYDNSGGHHRIMLHDGAFSGSVGWLSSTIGHELGHYYVDVKNIVLDASSDTYNENLTHAVIYEWELQNAHRTGITKAEFLDIRNRAYGYLTEYGGVGRKNSERWRNGEYDGTFNH